LDVLVMSIMGLPQHQCILRDAGPPDEEKASGKYREAQKSNGLWAPSPTSSPPPGDDWQSLLSLWICGIAESLLKRALESERRLWGEDDRRH
jgi:hypothetical protein